MINNLSADKKRLVSNFFSLSSVEAANYLFPIITLPYLVRILGPEKYGLINFAQSLAYYFVILTDYGFNLSATKEVSVNRDDAHKVSSIFNSIMAVKLALMAASIVIMGLLVFFVPKFRQDWLIYVFSFGAVIGNLLFPIWLFQGMERMKTIALLNLAARTIFLTAVFVFIRNEKDFIYVPLITSFGSVVSGIMSLVIASRMFGIVFSLPSWKSCKQALKDGWHVFISTVSVSLYTSSNAFILGLFTNNTIVGYFSAAEKIITFINKAFNPLLASVYPHISKTAAIAKEVAVLKLRKLFVLVILLSFVVFIVVLLFSRKMVSLILGPGYLDSIIIVRILSPLVFILPVSYIFANLALLPFNLNRYYAKIYIIGGLLNVVLLLTSLYFFRAGASGAALSVLITQAVITVLMFVVLRRNGIRIVNIDISSLMKVFGNKAVIDN